MFIYSAQSGVLIWDKTFEEISSGKAELFSSFFSALQSFVQEMIHKGSSELKNIELSDYIISFHPISQLNIDVVAIIDSKNEKLLRDFFEQVNAILLQHSDLFKEDTGRRKQFAVLDEPITKAVNAVSGLKSQESSNLSQRIEWIEVSSEEEDEIQACLKTRHKIYKKYEKETSLLPKLDLINKIIELDLLINNEEKLNADNREKRKIETSIKDTRMKIGYFLQHTKETLSKSIEHAPTRRLKDVDLRDSYIAFYSFSNKLKKYGKEQAAKIYSNLAKSLIETKDLDEGELRETVSYILSLPDDLSYYCDS